MSSLPVDYVYSAPSSLQTPRLLVGTLMGLTLSDLIRCFPLLPKFWIFALLVSLFPLDPPKICTVVANCHLGSDDLVEGANKSLPSFKRVTRAARQPLNIHSPVLLLMLPVKSGLLYIEGSFLKIRGNLETVSVAKGFVHGARFSRLCNVEVLPPL